LLFFCEPIAALQNGNISKHMDTFHIFSLPISCTRSFRGKHSSNGVATSWSVTGCDREHSPSWLPTWSYSCCIRLHHVHHYLDTFKHIQNMSYRQIGFHQLKSMCFQHPLPNHIRYHTS
jgi:hypothetical protein